MTREVSAERGSALVIVLMVAAACAALLMTLQANSGIDLLASSNHAARIEALYLADAGVQRTLIELSQDAAWRGDQASTGYAFAPGSNRLGRGSYLVTIAPDDGSLGIFPAGSLVVNSAGRGLRGIQRSVQVVVAPDGDDVFQLQAWRETTGL